MPNARADNSRVPLTRRTQRTWRTTVCAALALLSGGVASPALGAQTAKASAEGAQTGGVIELRNPPDPAPSLGAPPASLSLGWWALGVAVLVTLGGLSALASRRRQQRARRELSAILADSVPLPRTEVETPSLEADAPPRSRGNGLQPLSERQWLSQPPPSSYKDPTR